MTRDQVLRLSRAVGRQIVLAGDLVGSDDFAADLLGVSAALELVAQRLKGRPAAEQRAMLRDVELMP